MIQVSDGVPQYYTDEEAIRAVSENIDAVHIYHWGAAWTVPNTTLYLCDWDKDFPPFDDAQVEYNYGGMYSHAVSERFTAHKAGLYIATAIISWSVNVNGNYRGIYIYKNGAYFSGVAVPPQAIGFRQVLTMPIKLAVNDYIDLRLYQDSGGNLNATATASYDGFWLTMSRETY